MSQAVSQFTRYIERLARLRKPLIAFGLAKPQKEILASLRRARKYADIVLIGPQAIARVGGFKKIIVDNPEEKIAAMLVSSEAEGIIRGTLDDFKTREAYFALAGKQEIIEPAFLETPEGKQFFLTPASNPDGWEKEGRLHLAMKVAEFLREWNLKPKIAIFTGIRHETYPRKKHIRDGVVGALNKTYEDAEWIVARLQMSGYEAKNCAIDLNVAVAGGYNVIIPVNGMVGNQILRVVLLCGGKLAAAPLLGLEHFWEDNSRTETDFAPHIRFLAARINMASQSRNT